MSNHKTFSLLLVQLLGFNIYASPIDGGYVDERHFVLKQLRSDDEVEGVVRGRLEDLYKFLPATERRGKRLIDWNTTPFEVVVKKKPKPTVQTINYRYVLASESDVPGLPAKFDPYWHCSDEEINRPVHVNEISTATNESYSKRTSTITTNLEVDVKVTGGLISNASANFKKHAVKYSEDYSRTYAGHTRTTDEIKMVYVPKFSLQISKYDPTIRLLTFDVAADVLVDARIYARALKRNFYVGNWSSIHANETRMLPMLGTLVFPTSNNYGEILAASNIIPFPNLKSCLAAQQYASKFKYLDENAQIEIEGKFGSMPDQDPKHFKYQKLKVFKSAEPVLPAQLLSTDDCTGAISAHARLEDSTVNVSFDVKLNGPATMKSSGRINYELRVQDPKGRENRLSFSTRWSSRNGNSFQHNDVVDVRADVAKKLLDVSSAAFAECSASS